MLLPVHPDVRELYEDVELVKRAMAWQFRYVGCCELVVAVVPVPLADVLCTLPTPLYSYPKTIEALKLPVKLTVVGSDAPANFHHTSTPTKLAEALEDFIQPVGAEIFEPELLLIRAIITLPCVGVLPKVKTNGEEVLVALTAWT